MSYCTFWDYTILHRLREYEDPRSANENIFNYVTSSNNRDGLAIKAAGTGLLKRKKKRKHLLALVAAVVLPAKQKALQTIAVLI